ncbi:ZmpA/ZmpB/ZmpC family metallo-endopeptidase [Mesomycoplasma hyorhinis]|uniref:ZmpA/ZmpB/ZmpC family metallo-endopeptidase n=6 Tax=Mesomycoplasma hyorhinis TaxID=2100 RepID=UPI001F41F5A9|nr:ZmpA/ZmpB/ZmpC family metallo-endopeptidase [Mesomycoplasma hyorhinis]UVT33053.1 hypothetical protein NV228_00425 [Mesomycoplasma hyorhinis]UVT33726.1 hypothetical protein NV229_00420 [Mesomycoplasma hyorhinis]UVT34391.1 hypothetical protein NV230_00420 [Mesomycoplasma hyorhinis]
MQNEIEKPISNSISHTSMPFASIDKNNPIEENMKNFFEGKNIVSITNLNDQNEVVQNHNQDNLIKKLEIRFENNFTKIYDVEFFKTENNLVEYKIKNNNNELLYIAFVVNNENSVQLDLGDLSTLNLYSDSYNGLLSANNTDLKKLFLEKSFNETKIKAKEIISNIFNFYVNSVNITDDQKQRLATKIKENKEKLVFILSYLNRWFNFNINRWNFKNWLLFSNWFNKNKKVLILDYLIDLPNDFKQYLPHWYPSRYDKNKIQGVVDKDTYKSKNIITFLMRILNH